ncbi:MFS general substrate transporter [Calocera cornea HHB12733]|uniref:MFS general substrate transporter n=1 Tax=Calocera cornea HHB12733 TaxID=1353952 RepID=A0A165F170_9BASI|nr:MFS general substrate transporter [Calocera cornea HHB12733]
MVYFDFNTRRLPAGSALEMPTLNRDLDPTDVPREPDVTRPLLADAAERDSTDLYGDLDHVDSAAEKQLITSLDLRILPILGLMYMCSALDRGNLGNAESGGLSKDLHLQGRQFSMIVSALNVPYACLTVPGVMLARRIGAHVAMPLYMMCWGTFVLLNAAATNFTGMVLARFFLGAFEAGFAPTLISYLTSFYTRDELGQRVCAFYSMLAVAGALSGTLSYMIFQIESPSLRGWQLLFLTEGALTIVVALLSVAILPKGIKGCSFWSNDQKSLAKRRILRDSSSKVEEEYSHIQFFAPLKEPKLYMFLLIGFCYGTTGAVAGTFLPLILGRMGLSPVQTNLLTVGPNVLGALCAVVTARSSDRFRERSIHLISTMGLALVGLLMLLIGPSTLSYMGCFLLAAGAFPPSVLFHTWHNCNDTSHDSRAFRTGLLTFATNSGGILAANIFIPSDAPRYATAIGTSVVLETLGIGLVVILRFWMVRDNRLRDEREGIHRTSKDTPTVLLHGTSSDSFRYFL